MPASSRQTGSRFIAYSLWPRDVKPQKLISDRLALYAQLPKHERPSGAGASEIDDDSSDQITFCAAAPGPDLNRLMDAFADREGLAILNLSDRLPDWLPEHIRPHVFTPMEAKGLDFHSVCILNLGQSLEAIQMRRKSSNAVETMTVRLAIDRVRVAVSRPAERLYCLEVSPSMAGLALVQELLQERREWHPPAPVIPAAVLISLEEELLPLEERLQLCQIDARQFLEAKPVLAWVRAQQAAALLGLDGALKAHQGDRLARSVFTTVAQVAFCLAFRKVSLDQLHGLPNLYAEALHYAEISGDAALASIFRAIVAVIKLPADRAACLFAFGRTLADKKAGFAPWLEVELGPVLPQWLAELEELVTRPEWTSPVIEVMPRLYPMLRIADAGPRVAQLTQRGLDALIGAGQFQEALRMMDRQGLELPLKRAACLEGGKEFGLAAEQYLRAGDSNSALRCFRSVPDLTRSLELLATVKGHPAAESLEWIRRMQALVAERPANLPKVVTPPEFQYLQEILEKSLGVQRQTKPRKSLGRTASNRRK